jgi:CRISPR-associated protein Cmr6
MMTQNNANEVPLMFQAQISGRGQTQYIGDTTNIKRWVREWKDGAQNQSPAFISQEDDKVPQNKEYKIQKKKYKITWRIVSNSGQDEDIIRPVIAAGGFPYYPGASMKGAFLRACTPEQKIRYCGGKTSNNQTQPGILRFHGAYPQDETWKETELVDVIHPQQDWQVKESNSRNHSAFLQISLYQPTLVFGISSTVEFKDAETEWNTIWSIWEKALEKGIGCRVSAGYGQPVKHPETKLVTVGLTGQGLVSKLIDDVGEFRPNMFKAALRGHTLRLFSGVTDEVTAEELTRELWGGFAGSNGAVVGLLGIAFNPLELDIDSYRYNNSYMPTYELSEGVLNILCLGQVIDDEREKLKKLASQLIKFSMLLGGFGKSWRRVDHRLIYPDYLKGNKKPMIGCHWEFVEKTKGFYITIDDKLNNITNFLNFLQNKSIKEWVQSRGKTLSRNSHISNWREVWHPHKVQVWARIAKNITDSKAIKWFHGNYKVDNSIKSSALTGQMGQIGRIWHRMYPRYIKTPDQKIERKGKEFVEILTIFPDNSDNTCDFIDFLATDSEFTLVWKEK